MKPDLVACPHQFGRVEIARHFGLRVVSQYVFEETAIDEVSSMQGVESSPLTIPIAPLKN
jgi:hypothetical protein